MEIKTFYVGERPGGAWVFQIRNNKTGVPEVLSSFHTARVLLLDSDNELVELPEENTVITDPLNGEVTFFWPNESLFTEPGYYVMQLELISDSSMRKTTVQDILVKTLGGVVR